MTLVTCTRPTQDHSYQQERGESHGVLPSTSELLAKDRLSEMGTTVFSCLKTADPIRLQQLTLKSWSHRQS